MNKKGISLIVLIITIIVIIILAGAVILSLANNNPINEATEAKRLENQSAVNSAVSLYLGKVMAVYQNAIQIDAPGEVVDGDGNRTGGKVLVNNPANDAAKVGLKTSGVAGKQLYSTGTGADIKYTTDSAASGATAVYITPASIGMTQFPVIDGYDLTIFPTGNVVYVPVTAAP